MMTSEPASTFDVCILGGGLAGQGLALQLRSCLPELRILVVERNRFPLPAATAKVGESTVEIGAHYLDTVLGLKHHLQNSQLPKFGLRCFFGPNQDDFAQQDEIGPSDVLPVPTYQIDRGILENHLAEKLEQQSIELRDQCVASAIELNADEAGHRVQLADEVIRCRWLVDAAGRRGLLKKQLDLHRDSEHRGSSVWFRVANSIQVDQWSDDQSWQQRCCEQRHQQRYLSTVHLTGVGYWVWLIPLKGGITSVGIVFDPDIHQLEALKDYPRALAWLAEHQPRLAQELQGVEPLDFRFLSQYSYDCQQVFSNQRWALVGEAGLFLDPFYSPGSDFIAIANGYTCDLIRRDCLGEDIQVRSLVYQKLYDSYYRSTLTLFKQQYGGFGDFRMMSLKLLWDQPYYWGVLAWLYFTERYLDIRFMQKANQCLFRIREINDRVQAAFQQRAGQKCVLEPQSRFTDIYNAPGFLQLNSQLLDGSEANRSLERLETNIALLSDLAEAILALLDEAPQEQPQGLTEQLRAALG